MAKKYTESEIKRIVQKEIEKAKEEMNNQIIAQFKIEYVKLLSDSVDAFYDDYPKPPRVYERTDAFREGAKQGYRFQQSGDELDVEFVSDYVPDHPGWNKKNPQPYSGENIWKDAFMHGIHGIESVPVMKTPPDDLIRKQEQSLMDKISSNVINSYINSL